MGRRLVVWGVCLWLASTAGAVNTLTEDFDGPAHGFQVLHDGVFDGMGHFIMDDGDYIYRHVSTGDFLVDIVWDAIDMGGALGAGNYRHFYYQITDQDGTYFLPRLQNGGADAEASYLVIESNIGTGGKADYVESIGALDALALSIAWSDATGTYSVSRSVNGGPMQWVVDVTGFGPSQATRHEYFYDQETGNPAGDVYPVMSFDSYVMVPEPATLSLLGLAALGWRRRR